MKEDLRQERAGFVRHESAYILFQATTYRIGTTQTAEVIVSVRRTANPNERIGAEVWKCQFISPLTGEEVHGRRVDHVNFTGSWEIDSDSNDAMKDFTVTALVSSQSIGDLRSTVTFKYSEMS